MRFNSRPVKAITIDNLLLGLTYEYQAKVVLNQNTFNFASSDPMDLMCALRTHQATLAILD